MPYAPRVPCKFICCQNLVNKGEGFCSLHNAEKYKQDKRYRGTATSRGYDAIWKKVRAMYLRSNPLCYDCGKAAQMVHHVVSLNDGGERLLLDNLVSLCNECHGMRHGIAGRVIVAMEQGVG
jgi:5-methylcytosine-specific restriction protein A